MGSEEYMRQAIRLAVENVRKGGGPFGAIIIKDGMIISKSHNRVTELNDPTAHAEVMAIRQAAAALNDFNLSGCEIYSSCEPCPMCLGAIYWAKIDRVYFGSDKLDAAQYGFDDQWIENEIKAGLNKRNLPMVQILQDEALLAFLEWENFLDKKRY
jgi:guanine deaminase